MAFSFFDGNSSGEGSVPECESVDSKSIDLEMLDEVEAPIEAESTSTSSYGNEKG